MNETSSLLFYNQRIVLSAPIPEPVVWHISKVEDTSPKGVRRLTFAQEEWDEHKDVFEFEYYDNEEMKYKTRTCAVLDYDIKTERVVGMWADYWASNIEPENVEDEKLKSSTIHSTITYSGTKPELKIGGSYKKFTVKFYDDENEIDFKNGTWSFTIDGSDCSDMTEILTHVNSNDVEENQIKVKFLKDNTYIGKVLNVSFESYDGIESNIDIELLRL